MEFKESYQDLVTSPRHFIENFSFPDPARIKLIDCTLRDGEQMPGVAFSPETKYEIVKAMSDIGIHGAEIGFPAVSESERQTVKLAVEGKRRGELRPDFDIVLVCRTAKADVDATVEGLEDADVDPAEVYFSTFTSGSDLHIKYKIGRVLMRQEGRDEADYFDTPVEFFRQANIRLLVDAVKYIRSKGVKKVQIVAEDVSRANVDYIIQLYQAGIAAGGTRPCFADTVGCLIPEYAGYYARRLIESLGAESEVYTHFHNDYGLATINNIAAFAQGMEVFNGSLNGLGERAGNASLQEFVAALRWLYGIEIPGFRYDQLRAISRLVERHSGVPIALNDPIIGGGVFTHESGVHTAGVLIDPRIYESVPSEAVGAETGYLYGKHSGTLIVKFALQKNKDELDRHGIEITEDLVHKVTEQVKVLREKMAEGDHAEKIVDEIEAAVARLGLTEQDVLNIALAAKSGQ